MASRIAAPSTAADLLLAARRAAYRRLRLPTRTMRPFALPGAPALYHARWRRLVRGAPRLSPQAHAGLVGLREIEQPLACPLCRGTVLQPLLRPSRAGSWSYHVVRCARCGLLYRHPGIRPERLGDLYAGRYGDFLTGRYAHRRRQRYEQVLDAFSPLFDDGRGRRLLDFGCGAGLFLEVAHQRGFEGWGVDLSPDAVARAHERPGGERTFVGAPADVPEIAAGGFDVVTMWSVLAHLATPVQDLTTLRSLLRPDGVLLLLTVNAASLLLKADRDRWGGFTANHLMFWSPATLPELLRRAGFGAVVIRSMHGPDLEAGSVRLRAPFHQLLRRTTAHGEQANMLRAVAFADPDGPARWGLAGAARRLSGQAP